LETNKLKYLLPILIGVILSILTSCSNTVSTDVNYSFKTAINTEYDIDESQKINFETCDDLNLGFFRGYVWQKLEIFNNDEPQSFMYVNDDLLNHTYKFYKFDTLNQKFKLVNSGGSISKEDYRTFPHPNPNFKIDIAPNEHATFIIAMHSDGRTVNVTPRLIFADEYNSFFNQNRFWSIVFLGTIFILLLLNIYLKNLYKQKIYTYYILYMLSTLIMYLGFEGYLYSLGVENLHIDHLIFLSVRAWTLTLIIFTSRFFEVRRVHPKFNRFVGWLLAMVLGGNTIYQLTFYQSSIAHLHYYENILSLFWLLLILVIILISARDRKPELKYYLIPLSCLLLFIIIGLIDGHFQVFPGSPFIYIKIGTLLEFIGFTYFMTLLIKRKIQRSDNLQLELEQRSEELIESSKKLEELNELLKAKTSIERTDLLNVFSLLESSLSKEDDWEDFKEKFEELNPSFLKHLIDKHSDLSKSEIRLLTLIRIDYSQKEIAGMLNIAADSVKKARSRVRKKMNIAENIRLKEYLQKL
jgi:DNA-directed RNA polymerase specialized sigma24 family protein